MLYTFKIYPYGMARTCYRTLQVDGSCSFDELAGDILRAFDFDFDHMYEFRTKLRHVDGNITYSLGEDYCPYDFWKDGDEDTEETNSSDETETTTEEIEYYDPDPEFGEYDIRRPITHLNPEKGTKFYFHYDFGDNWYFVIHVSKAEKDKSLSEYSKCIKSVGNVKQYDYDDDDYDEDDYEDDE